MSFFQGNLHYRQDLTHNSKFKETSFPSVMRLSGLQNGNTAFLLLHNDSL